MIEAVAFRALSSRSRLEILKQLYRGPLSVEEMAQKLGLQPITIRHHLRSLEEAGFIEAYEERGGSVGRPKIHYKMVKQPPLVSFPKRRYLMLSSFLINTLQFMLGANKAKKILRKTGLDMGENTARRLETEHEIREWSPKTYEQFFVKGHLEEVGAEPEIVEVSDKKIVYRLHNCLFSELSAKMPEIMCDVIHQSFYEGLVKAMDKDMKINRHTCMAEGDPYCEHSCAWIGK